MVNGIGYFYKAVRNDLTSYYNNGFYKYKLSDKMKLKRNNIDCGEGFHFCSFWQAFKNLQIINTDKIIQVKIKLEDIMHVSNQYIKIRVRAYSEMQEVNIDDLTGK